MRACIVSVFIHQGAKKEKALFWSLCCEALTSVLLLLLLLSRMKIRRKILWHIWESQLFSWFWLSSPDTLVYKVTFTQNGTPSISSVEFNRSVLSNSLRPHRLQHVRPPCPSPTPRVYSDSCSLSLWCHPSHPLLSSSPPTFNLSQHQGLFKGVSSLQQVA